MNPLEQKVKDLEQLVQTLVRVENLDFLRNLKRRFPLPEHKLSDHTDVSNTDSASTGQVLKKTATTWQPGTDIDT